MKKMTLTVILAMAMMALAVGCSGGSGDDAENSANGDGGSAGAVNDATSSVGNASIAAASEIKIGMTYDEVKAILGDPQNRHGSETDFTAVWEKDGVSQAVVFADGKVQYHGHGGDEMTADEDRVKANFGKVTMGMSEQQVKDLLGPATGGGGVAGTSAMTWDTEDGEYSVVFHDGKVVGTDRP